MKTGMMHGTRYGGWWLPDNCGLDSSSIIVSAGAGEDISFDLVVQSKYGCRVEILDPTVRALKHFDEIQTYYASGKTSSFSCSIQPDYKTWIDPITPDFSKIVMNPVGLWEHAGNLKFYHQDNPNYVSQTLIPNLYGGLYTVVPVERLSAFLKRKGIETVDVLKLDIEGAEIQVLETMLEDSIYPRILCVEFDYYLKGADTNGITRALIEQLISVGYELLHNNNWNMVFTNGKCQS